MDLPKLLASLAHQRPLFHSEKDFQHALAWEIHTHHPDAKVRLEYPPVFMPDDMYVDLWVMLTNGTTMALELKYRTLSLDTEIEGEAYRLRDHKAQNQGLYVFLRDVMRLEQLTAADGLIIGAAILLTNDSYYWKLPGPRSSKSAHAAFRLHEGSSLSGELAWGPTIKGGKKDLEASIKLASEYCCKWADYSSPSTQVNGQFRYLLFDVANLRKN
jgi:hypothetical protein